MVVVVRKRRGVWSFLAASETKAFMSSKYNTQQ